MSTILTFATPTARKDHACGLCRGTITKGEAYIYTTSLENGEFCTFKSHTVCNTLAVKFGADDTDDGGMDDYGFLEEVWVYVRDNPSERDPIFTADEDAYIRELHTKEEKCQD